MTNLLVCQSAYRTKNNQTANIFDNQSFNQLVYQKVKKANLPDNL